MNSKGKSCLDPLIDEVRQRRRDLFAKHGNDLRKLYQTIQDAQAKHPEKMSDRPRAQTARTNEG